MSNLLERHEERSSIINEEDAATGKISLVKVYGLIATVILLAVVTSLSFMSGQLFAGTFFLLLFLALYIVGSVSLRGGKYALISSLFSGLGLAVFIFTPPFKYFFIFTLALIIFLFWAHYTGSKEYKNMVKLNFFTAAKPVGSLVIVGVAIFFSYILVANGNALLEEKNVSRLVDIVVVPSAKPFVGDFSSSSTLDDVLASLAEKQLSKDNRFLILSESKQKVAISGAQKQLAIQLEDMVGSGVKLDLNASITENVKNSLETVANQIPEDKKAFWGGLMILFILVTALGFKLLIYYPVALIALVMYELLIGIGFIQVKLETRTKEILELN